MLWLHLTTDPLADVHAYYVAAARLNAGLPLYPPGADTNAADFYRYPPLLAILFRPLALLPFEVAAAIWEAICIGAFVLTLFRLGLRRREVWIAVGVLAMPIAWTLAVGQAQSVITLLLVIGSPAAIAFAANLKLFPALVAIYWLSRRDWHALGRFALWCAALLAVQVVLAPGELVAFLGVTNLSEVGEVRNISPYAISPALWVGFLAVLLVVAWRAATTRWGWAAAVTLSVLAPPRLLSYMLMSLLAVLRRPEEAATAGEVPPADVASAGPAVD
jgi:hypothetical protein